MLPFGGRQLTMFFVGIALCSLLAGGVVVESGSASGFATAYATPEAQLSNVESESFEADRTVFIITVRENGSAEWRFRYEQRLETDAEIEDFRTYAERFNTEETDSFANFRERAIALTASGNETTGREMSAERFNRSARIEERPPSGDEFAIIEMSFEWTEFAEIDDGSVVVGDVFTGGLYVGPDQQLRFERGSNLQFESVVPDPDSTAAETIVESESVTWIGERQFTDRHPRVVFVERETEPASNESTPTETDSEPENADDVPENEDGMPENGDDVPGNTGDSVVPLAAIVIVIVLGLGLGAAVAYRAGVLSKVGQIIDRIRSDETDADRSVDAGASADDTSVNGGLDDTAAGGKRADDATASAITDEQYLSDEERVIALLKAQEGRMKQVDIVDQTDWSKSKVSMLLSEMESEGTVSKLRVGRENIVSLAGHEPEAVGSPFDDE